MALEPARRHHLNDVADVARIPRPRRPAVLFFAYPSFAYGHVARCHKIARALVRTASVDAYVVSSYPDYSTGAHEEAVHEVFLPAFGLAAADPPPERLPIPDPVSPLAGVPVSELSAHRAALLRVLVGHLAPRGLHCKGFPFIRPDKAIAECGPALTFLAAESPATLRSAGFNGVPTALYAQDEHRARLIERTLRDAVDILFVYVGEAERADVLRQCPPLAAVEERLRFVGYVGGAPPGPASDQPRILAMFGGASTRIGRSCWSARRSPCSARAGPGGNSTW
jgi:predicted glycosyltransferase